MITAQSADGTQHQFPDGTADSVIDGVMKDYAAKSTPQPSLIDKIAGSPIGRAVHDVVLSPLSSIESALGSQKNLIGPGNVPQTLAGPVLQKDAATAEGSYQASLANNRNTPGYSAALQNAQAVQARRGSGFGDQVTSAFNPAAAGVAGLVTGGLDQADANADVQSQTQDTYAQQHPILATAANLVGGLAMGAPTKALANLPAAAAKTAIPTLADISTAKSAAYDAADKAGVVIKPQSFQQFATDLGTDITKNNVVQADIHKNALSALGVIQDEAWSGVPMTLSRADAVRQAVNGAIEKAGGPNGSATDLRMAQKVKSGLDSYLDSIGPSDVVSGDPATAVPILKQARGLAQQEFKAKQIQQVIDLANNSASTNYSASGVEQALRAGFKNLNAQFIKDPSAAAGWTQAEQDAIAAVAKGTKGANALRLMGKFAPTGVISGGSGAALGAGAGGMVGGPVGAMVGSAALPMAGGAARLGATALTRQAAQKAMDTVLAGKSAPMLAAQPALNLPRLTSASRLPLGLPLTLPRIQQPAQ